MPIQKQILLLIVVGIIALVGSLYLATNLIVLKGFGQIEVQETQQNVLRARDPLSDNLIKMGTTAADYTSWDDTYAYIDSHDPTYDRILRPIIGSVMDGMSCSSSTRRAKLFTVMVSMRTTAQ